MIKLKKHKKDFETIIKIVSNLTFETDYTFQTDKIIIRAVHPSNHCLAIFEIDKSMFEEYDIKEEVTYTLDNEALLKLFRLNKGKELIMNMEPNSLIFSDGTHEYNLKTYIGQKDVRDSPVFNTTSIWSMNSDKFFTLIKELIPFSTIGQLIGADDLKIKIKSNLIEGKSTVEAEQIKSEETECWYDLEYMDKISNIKNIFETIRLGFGKDEPCEIRLTNEYLNFRWILASRMAEDG